MICGIRIGLSPPPLSHVTAFGPSTEKHDVPVSGTTLLNQLPAEKSEETDADTPLGEVSTFGDLENGAGIRTSGSRPRAGIVVRSNLRLNEIQNSAAHQEVDAQLKQLAHYQTI